MKIVIFGLSISSSWGNGHAALLRGLLKALHRTGHETLFFERDTPYYASHRDAESFDYARLCLYSDWWETLPQMQAAVEDADVGVVTSYCPDGRSACELLLSSRVPRTVFYDMDTPVTLDRLEQGESVPYLPQGGLRDFDLVLSYTGGRILDRLRTMLDVKCTATLYGWVDPDVYKRVEKIPAFESDASYLGTYSPDRQAGLERLFLDAARELGHKRFVIGGAMYPWPPSWPKNVLHFEHVAPPQHAGFYSSSPVTLNVTRASMASMGFCPSGRLFEAAACQTAVLSDWWEGLDTFFEPGEEILITSGKSDTVAALQAAPGFLERIGRRASERALECHTAEIRARRLIQLIEDPQNEQIVQEQASVTRGA